jgi:hypothetical protein
MTANEPSIKREFAFVICLLIVKFSRRVLVSCTNHPQRVLFRGTIVRVEVNAMVAAGLIFLGLVIRAVLGTVVVVALVYLLFKLGKLAEAYTKKLQPK